MAFPTSPSDGQEYTTILGTVYKYRASDDCWYIINDFGSLDDIDDVVITTPGEDEVLAYDNGSSTWINQTPAEAGLEPAFSKNTGFNKNFGTITGTVAEGDDSRFHTPTVAGDLNLNDLAEKNHASLANKNAETDFKHLTDAQQSALHSDVVTTNAHVQALSINNLSEDSSPQLGGNLDLNDKAITHELVAAVSLVNGNLCYMNGSGKMDKADADAEATCDTLLAMCLDTISADATGTFLLLGKWTTTGLTAGANYYVSLTAGGITLTKPSTAGDIIRLIGTAVSTTVLFFKPSEDYIEYV